MRASLVQRVYAPRQAVRPRERQHAGAAQRQRVYRLGQSALVFSESSKDGELLFSASFPAQDMEPTGPSASRGAGTPKDRPAAVAKRVSEDEVRVYASWNGATEVAAWEVLSGPTPRRTRVLGIGPPRRIRDGHLGAYRQPVRRRAGQTLFRDGYSAPPSPSGREAQRYYPSIG